MSVKCICCGGEGKDYRWQDRDCIEGYKLASKYHCFFCEGEGYIEESDARYIGVVAYLRAMQDAEDARKRAIAEREARREMAIMSARAKLTQAELEALGLDETC